MKNHSPFRQQSPMQNVTNSRIKTFAAEGMNPYHVSHVQKAFKLTNAKVNFKQPKAPELGSPWTSMTKGK